MTVDPASIGFTRRGQLADAGSESMYARRISVQDRRMIRRLVGPVVVVAVALTITLSLGAGSAAADPPPPAGTPSAVQFNGVPSVGAIFEHGLHNPHTCSASVVQSPGHDLVLTAAHCISGTGVGIVFAPGYEHGKTAYGVWTVVKTWVSRTWKTSQDPHNDYAFLQIASQVMNKRRVNIQDVTGGAVLGVAPRVGTNVTDIAYPAGIDDSPITCTTKLPEPADTRPSTATVTRVAPAAARSWSSTRDGRTSSSA